MLYWLLPTCDAITRWNGKDLDQLSTCYLISSSCSKLRDVFITGGFNWNSDKPWEFHYLGSLCIERISVPLAISTPTCFSMNCVDIGFI